MTSQDGNRSGIKDMLHSWGGIIFPPLPRISADSIRKDDVVTIVFIARNEGRFPSRNLRVLRSREHARGKGFVIPEEFSLLETGIEDRVIIIKPDACNTVAREEALKSAHYRDIVTGKWTGDKHKRASRLTNLQARRVERRQRYIV